MSMDWLWRTLSARRRIAGGIFAAVLALTLVLVLALPKQWSARSVLAVDEKASDPLTGAPVAVYLIPGYMQTQTEIAKSHQTALKVIDILRLDQRPEIKAAFLREREGQGVLRDWLAERLQKKLDVVPGRESSLLTLRFTAPDPKTAVEMTNGFAQAYMMVVAEMQTSAAQQQSRVFQQQLLPLQDNLEKTQQRLAAFQRQSGILVDSDPHSDLNERRLNELTTQLTTAEAASVDARARSGGHTLAPDVKNNPMIQQQEALLAQSEVKLRSVTEILGPNHPQYRQALAERDAHQRQLHLMTNQYVKSLKQSATNASTRQSDLSNAVAREQHHVLTQREQAVKLKVLQKEAEDAQRVYSQVLQRYSETRLASHVSQTNLYVLQAALTPTSPSWPRPLLSLVAALVFGGLMAIGGVFLAETLDRRIRVARDLEKMLGLPVLAVVDYDVPVPARRLAPLFTRLKSFVGAR